MAVTVLAGVASALGAAAAQIGAAGFFATLFSTAGAAAFAIGAGLSLVSRALAPKPSLGNQMRGITTTTREPAGSRKLVYGQMRVGGQVVFIDHSGTDNAYLHMVIVFASHEIESFEEFWFNDKKVYENNAVVSDWSSVATITKFDGSQTTADSTLVSASSNWTNDHILNGMAYAHFKLEWDQDKFPQGVPNITAVIKGKKVYDPRDTNQSASDSSTWTYSTNPALCLRDYLVDEKYGLAEDRTLIDETVLDATADLCDETQEGGVDIYSVSGQKRYTLNGVIDTRNSIKDNIEQLLSAMGGRLTFSGGKYFIEGAEYKTPTVTFDESVVISEMQTQTKQSRRGIYNGVKGIFVSEEKNWKVLDYPAQISSTYATEDGDPIYLDMPLPFVTNNLQAQLLAKIALLKSRQQTTLTMTVNLTGLKLKVGDTVMVTNSRLGYSSKVFEVIDYTLANSPGGEIGVQLQLLETASAVYDWTSSDEEDFLQGGELDLYDGRTVDNVTSLTATEIGLRGPDGGVSSSIELSWIAPDDAFVEYYTVRYNKNGTTDYFEIETRETNLLISGLDVTSNYDFRVQAQNLLGVRSSGTSITNRALTGDTTAPSAPTGGAATGGIQTITAEWSNPSDIDFKHVEVFVNTTNSIPASPTAVVDGEEYVVTGLSGAVTRYFWLKSVDFSGNKSAATASFNGTSVVASNSDIGTGAVDTDEIQDDAVTIDKIANTLESTNYVANTSGWRLTTAGDFEAGDGTFRGAVTATSGSFGGTTIASNKIYQGTGTWANSNTGFYLDNTGQFSLKDSLFFNPTNSRLTVSGNITADTITVEDTLEVFGPLKAKSLAAGSITREMLSQDVLDEIFGALATSVGGSNGDYKEGTGNFTTSGGTVTLGTSSDKFDHGTADVDVEFIIDHFFYATTNYTTAQAQATLNFEVSADGTFTDLTSATKTHTLQFLEYDLSSYYGYTYLVYYLTGDVTKTFTSGSGNDIPDDTDLQFRVRVTGVGTAFTSQTVPFTLEANEGVTGVVSTGGNADTLDNLDSTAFLRSNTNDTFDGDLTITGQLILQGSIDQYNVTDLDVTDKTITVNSGNTQSLSDGAGLVVDRGTAADASITWDETNDEFDFSHPIKVAGSVGVTNIVTNKVVKFNGTIFDDSNITDTGSAITLGSNTTVSGTLSSGAITTSGTLDFTANPAYIRNDQDNLGQIIISAKNSSGSAQQVRWDAANAGSGAWRPEVTNVSNLGLTNRIWNTLYVNSIRMGSGNDLFVDASRNITSGTINSGAITATNISATSLSLSGAFTPTSIAATSTVSGSQFRASYGSESAPAFTFKNDDDTGMYGSAARIHFAVSGDEKIQVQPSSIILYESTTIQNELKVGTVPQIVITSARALQNVTASANIITSGTFDSARIPSPQSGDWWNNGYAKVQTDGVMEIGKYIDWHDTDAGTSDFSARLTNTGAHLYASGRLHVDNSQRVFADNYHPNADKWTTARTLTLSGDVTGSVSWDGSSNVTMTTTGGGGAVSSVTNFVDNRVVTASGSSSLNGEANLTFDGTNLVAGNNITANGSFVTATSSQAQGIYAGSTQVFQGSTRNLINIGTINSGSITATGRSTFDAVTIDDDGSNSPLLRVVGDDHGPWLFQLENASATNNGLFQAYINNNNNLYFRAKETGAYPTWYFQISNGSNHVTAMYLNSSGINGAGHVDVASYKVSGTTRINSVGDGLFTSLYIGSTNIVDTNRNLVNIVGLYGNGGTLNHYNTNHVFKSTTSNLQAQINDTGIGVGVSPQAVGAGNTTAGLSLYSDGRIFASKSGNTVMSLNRNSSDGVIAEFRKDGSTVGSIGSNSGAYLYIASDNDVGGIGFYNNSLRPVQSNGNVSDADQDLGNSSARWRSLYLSSNVVLGTDKYSAAVYRRNAVASIDNTGYTTLFTVDGNNLGSAIRMNLTGTTSSVVVNVTADIMVGHYQDILITSRSGFYTIVTLKVTSNNNEDFAVEAKTNSANALTVRIEVFPESNENVTFTSSHSFTGSSHEHQCYYGTHTTGTGGNDGDLRVNGRTFIQDGSASSPALIFANDHDTGFYRHTTNDIGVATAGAVRARFGTAGMTVYNQLRLNDTNTQIIEGGGNSIRLKTNSGYVEIGPQNTSWAHFYTDRANYYFNTGITVDGGIVQSYNEDLTLRRAQSTAHQIQIKDTGVEYKNTGGQAKLTIQSSDTADSYINFSAASNEMSLGYDKANNRMAFTNHDTLDSNIRMMLGSAGDWVVSNTNPRVASQFNNQAGMGWYESDLHAEIATTGNRSALELGRNNSTATGDFLVFRKQATVIGSVGVEGGDSLFIQSSGSTGGGLRFHSSGRISPVRASALSNNAIDLGASTQQFANLYLGTGLYMSGSQVIDSSRNIKNVPVIYGTGSNTAIELNHATYTMFANPEGARCLYLGDSGDAGNYYDNGTHYFRSAGGGTVRATISSAGMQVQHVNNTYNFRAYGQDGDSFFGVYDDANNSANIILTRSDGATMFRVMGHTGATTIAGSLSSETINIGSGHSLQSNGTTVIDSNRNLTNIAGISASSTVSAGSFSSGYGLSLTNGNTDFLLYNNTNENVLYMRDTTNGQMLQTWHTDKVQMNKNLMLSGTLTVGNTTVIDTSRNITSRSIVAEGNGTTSSTNALKVTKSGGESTFTVRDDGVVLVQSNYLYVNNNGGFYSTGMIRARGGITNDGGNALSISSGAAHIAFNSKNFASVGTISSGQITSSGSVTAGDASSALGFYVGTTQVITGTRNLVSIGSISCSSVTSTNDLKADGGNLIMGDDAFSSSASYVGMKTSHMSGANDYMIISGTGDGNTYVSAKDGFSVYIRGGGNNSANEIRVTDGTYIQVDTDNFNVEGNITAYHSSDQSLKQNIRVIDNPIERIQKIRGVFFDWTDDHIKNQSGDGAINIRKDDVGVIAQDVQPVLDEVVTTRKNGTLAVRYEKMVALCIEAIKEQQETIESLTKRIEELENGDN